MFFLVLFARQREIEYLCIQLPQKRCGDNCSRDTDLLLTFTPITAIE
jgi:hypothetical protein